MDGERIDARRFDGISGEEVCGTEEESRVVHTLKMSADTSWYTRVWAGAPVETQGSNPWNIYGDRVAPIFIWYEKSRLRRARGKPEKYTSVISLYLWPIRFPFLPLLSPAFFIQPIVLCHVFSHVPMCGFVSLFVSFCVRSQGKTAARLLPRKGPFYLRAEDLPSLWTSSARHANARWRDEILGGAESRISIKAIAVPFAILLFTA